MLLLEHWSDMTFTLNDVVYFCSIVATYAILRYRVLALESRTNEIISKQDDFRKKIYEKLEANNKFMFEIKLSIEKLRSELLSKIK